MSYAHLDEKPKNSRAWVGEGYPNAFVRYLQTALKPLFGQVPPEKYLFFDAKRLASEVAWEPAIEEALAQSELFIFLVSVHSLASDYCMQKELSTAVKRGIPIIPVLLTPFDGWTEHKVVDPDHPHHPPRCLGDFHSGGLPKDGAGNLLAVDQWDNEHVAWNKACADIVTFIKAGLPKPKSAVLPVVLGTCAPVPHELLPYFCDQGELISHCRMELGRWGRDERNALFLLLKGGDEDGMDRFARRVLVEVIKPRLPPQIAELASHRVFDWPSFNPKKPDEVRTLMEAALLEALGLSPAPAYDGCAAAFLKNHLDGRPDVPVVHLFLPDSTPAHKPGLQALLHLLEAAELGKGRLILLLFIQDMDTLAKKKDLARTWGLTGFSRTLSVEPPPLGPIGDKDVTQWHQTREIEQTFGIRLHVLKAQLFPTPTHTHRLRSFADHFVRLSTEPKGDRP